jgi:hypothetical protein
MAKKTTKTKKTKKVTSKPKQPEKPKIEQPANPEFEKEASKNVTEPKKENRGGARPGAGRPPGLTDEKAKVKNLPQYPSIPIRQGCQALFDLWSSAAKIEQLSLSDEEADLLSLPLTQLQEFYFPGILPEIAGTWIMLIFAATRVVKPRIEIVNQVRAERRAEKQGGDQPGKLNVHYSNAGGSYLHKLEPGDPGQWTPNAKNVTCPTCKKILDKKGQN